MVNKPPFLLADEPTGNLDPALSKEILLLFEEFNNVGVTVLIATHDLALIARMPHRSLILREARLLGNGNQTPFPSALDDEAEHGQPPGSIHTEVEMRFSPSQSGHNSADSSFKSSAS